MLPGQEVGGGAPEPVTLFTEEGAGILVSGQERAVPMAPDQGSGRNLGARIDGFTIKSADTGGGIVVNGYTEPPRHLQQPASPATAASTAVASGSDTRS